MSDHDHYRGLVAAHALGNTTEDDEAVLEVHLRDCGECRADVDELAAVVSILDRDARADLLPSPGLEDRIVAAAVHDTRTRSARWNGPDARWPLLAAVVALVLGVGLGSALTREPGAQQPSAQSVAFASVTPAVTADADLVAHTWGTEIILDVDGLESGATYQVSVRDEAGAAVQAGSFLVGDRPVRCSLNAALLRPEVTRITVTDAAGAEVLVADARSA